MSVEVLLCCGVGGAGKTTSAAALAVALAASGRQVVVLTIDPARRLADALGIDHLGNEPQALDLPEVTAAGGRLDALMLDRKATWDALVRTHAGDADLAARLLANPYYEALSTRLTGGHEYMATERLHQLAHDGRWDVVVVDTPPSQHAVDFFRAPARIRRILDRNLLGALLTPSQGLLGVATRRAVDVVRRLAGPKVLDDLVHFFELVGSLAGGLRERSAAVQALLQAPTTRVLLVASAVSPREEDLLDFLGVVREDGLQFGGYLLTRAAAPLGLPAEALVAAIPDGARDVPAEAWAAVRAALADAVHRRARDSARHVATAARLAAAGRAPVWTLPEVDGGVADLDGLRALVPHLPPAPPRLPAP
ncbi:MAG: AAA family ATPase [Alphaproteobacteria bacterium]|nr:AAA family ATPase [Alphaproteobacteria bacterium]